MRKLIEVTKDDIKKGRKGSPSFCPVAIALARQVDLPKPSVGSYIKFNGVTRMQTPRSVERFFCRFDTGNPVKPFRFYLKSV